MRFFDGPDTVRRARECLRCQRLHGRCRHGATRAPRVRPPRARRTGSVGSSDSAGDRLDTLPRSVRRRLSRSGPPTLGRRWPHCPSSVGSPVGWSPSAMTESGRVVAIRPLGGPGELVRGPRLRPPRRASISADHVLGVSASTRWRWPARRSAARSPAPSTSAPAAVSRPCTHPNTAARVVASDLNPRAAACATLTMEINDVANVSVREGDLFAPGRGRALRPDRRQPAVRHLPVASLPLPRQRVWPSTSCAAARPIGAGVTSPMAGTASCWPPGHTWPGEDWRDRVRAWFEDTGCDALVLEREVLEPAAHAASWLRQTEPPDRLGTRVRRVDRLLRTARHRGRRFRSDHHAEA